MVPYDRLSPGYWYVKSDRRDLKGWDIVEVCMGADELFVYTNEDFRSLSEFQFVGPVPDPYLGKWDNV